MSRSSTNRNKRQDLLLLSFHVIILWLFGGIGAGGYVLTEPHVGDWRVVGYYLPLLPMLLVSFMAANVIHQSYTGRLV